MGDTETALCLLQKQCRSLTPRETQCCPLSFSAHVNQSGFAAQLSVCSDLFYSLCILHTNLPVNNNDNILTIYHKAYELYMIYDTHDLILITHEVCIPRLPTLFDFPPPLSSHIPPNTKIKICSSAERISSSLTTVFDCVFFFFFLNCLLITHTCQLCLNRE